MRAIIVWCAAMALLGPARASSEAPAVSEPRLLAEVDMAKLKGIPTALTWSPTDGEYYLQTSDNGTIRHYIFRAATDPRMVEAEPEWATTYWNWKSSRNVPGHPELLIAVTSHAEKAGIPTQSLRDKAAGMSSGTTAMQGAGGEAMAEEYGTHTRTLVLEGETIGEFKDAPLIPGETFGWSPEPLHAVAYVTPHKQLALLDLISKQKQLVESSKDVSLPAWSLDGTAIIYLQKSNRKKYSVMKVDVVR